jgi:hypothetical protein
MVADDELAGGAALREPSPNVRATFGHRYPAVDWTADAWVTELRFRGKTAGWLVLQGEVGNPSAVTWLPNWLQPASDELRFWFGWVNRNLIEWAESRRAMKDAVTDVTDTLAPLGWEELAPDELDALRARSQPVIPST